MKKSLSLFLVTAVLSAHAAHKTSPPPTLQATIVTPTANATVTSPMQFSATTLGATNSQLVIDGTAYASYKTSSISVTLKLPAGSHQIVLQAFSRKGAKVSASESVTVQAPPPQAAIVTPAPNATVASPVQFTGTTSGASRSELDVDGAPYASYQSSSVSASLTLTPGAHQIVLLAFNQDGTKASASEAITVQAPPPTATIVTPTANATVASPVQFTGTTSGASRSELDVDGAPYGSYQSSSVSASLKLTPGAHQIVLLAFNQDGTKATASESITVPAPPPTATIVTPTANATVQSPVQFTGTTSGASRSELDVDGAPYASYQSSSVSASLTLTPGAHQIVLLAFAQDGTKATASEAITVQAPPPPPTATITTPTANATVASPVQFTGTTSGASRSEIDVDGAPYASYQSSSVSASLTLTPGTHQIVLLAFAQDGTKVSASESITVQAPQDPPAVPTVSVKTYGATGNGSTDDTAAINAAIAALPSSGAILYFPCGTYAVFGQLSVISTSNTTVNGAGSCSVIRPAGSSTLTGLHIAGAGLSGSVKLASDTTKNTFTTTVGGLASLDITAGSYVLVSTTPTASNGPNSPLIADQQTVKVLAVAGDTATIELQFSLPFTVAAGSSVQRILSPVVNDVVSNLVIDGSSNSGSGSMGLQLAYAADSSITNVTISNFLGTGGSGGYIIDTGYNNTVTNSTCLYCGNGGSNGRQSFVWQRQSYGIVTNLTVTNKSTQSVFGVAFHQAHFTTANTITVDHGKASGRVFKLQRADNNTFNGVTANNGTGGDNGITISDQSSYNTFNNCVANNNEAKGIALFGNFNTHNTFKNCTAMYNTMAAFAQGPDYAGNYHDDYTTVTGGTFCCQRVNSSNLVALHSLNTVFTGANIYDDLRLAANGLVGDGSLAVTNNTFSGLPYGRDIYVNSGISVSIYSTNTTPDGTSPATF